MLTMTDAKICEYQNLLIIFILIVYSIGVPFHVLSAHSIFVKKMLVNYNMNPVEDLMYSRDIQHVHGLTES